MDLLAMGMEENARKMKMTVLHRPGGEWHNVEIGRLVNGLKTVIKHHPQHPEFLVLWGHHTKEQTLAALWGGVAYTAKQITGIDSKELPFPVGLNWL